MRLLELLRERPIASLKMVADRTGLSFPAASSGMRVLERAGVARELTGKKRNRLYGYDKHLAILNEGTELP